MLNIAIKCDVGDGRFDVVVKHYRRVEYPFTAAMPKRQSPTFVFGREHDDEGPKHGITARGVFVRLEKCPLS